MRRFNVTGLCVPEEDYMVDISGKIEQIRKLVDDRCYFTINRARQYGKTTTLACLEKAIQDDYLVASISFEGFCDASFESPESFGRAFLELVSDALEFTVASDDFKKGWLDYDGLAVHGLSRHITKMCKDHKVVLMIDEVDKTSNNRVFLHFIGMLRNKFLARKNRKDHTFHSVILAGVYDIKNVKLKLTGEGVYSPTQAEDRMYNSPWNIAADFDVDMSFSPAEIATMLAEYESDHGTGMDVPAVSEEIYSYTSGYPFLVSRICQHVDQALDKNWTLQGVRDAVDIILDESNTLFDDLIKNLENNRPLFDFMRDLLFMGNDARFTIDNPLISLGHMYGFLKKSESGKTVMANRIFENRLYEYFLSKNHTSTRRVAMVVQNDVVKDGRFDMALCLRKFADHYAEVWSERDAAFIEREGRLLFLSYLKPLINGQGFYHIESQFTDLRRMDVVVDFGRDQFIVELKLWHGEASHDKAYEQILGYMGTKGAAEGYLLTFDFRKGANKQPYAKWVELGRTRVFDVVV